MFSDGRWHDAALVDRAQRAPGARSIAGPAIVAESNATTVVEPGWRRVTALDHLCSSGRRRARARARSARRVDPVLLEVFNNLFMAIAEQMGVQLQNTAYSVNIKERLDFSCALFDADGNLIANAPHMPVHLGSMSEAIKTVIARERRHDAAGRRVRAERAVQRRHAPARRDRLTPVFLEDGERRCRRSTSARAATTPTSAASRRARCRRSRPASTRRACCSTTSSSSRAGASSRPRCARCSRAARYPSRNPEQNLADLSAQVAANAKGVQRAAPRWSRSSASTSCGLHAARAGQRRGVGAPRHHAAEGRRVHAAARQRRADQRRDPRRREQRAAPRSTSPAPRRSSTNNFNAPSAVCKAAVLYVFRTLVDDDIPMNAGCLKPLKVIIPEGSMLDPRPPAAVVAGNVETSTCITDALYGALGVMAASQGTMNNFTFGNARHQYYETISGGSGAGPSSTGADGGFDGTSVVQTHMTNSRLTDPEVLEWRFPVRLDSFEHPRRHRRRRRASRRRRRRAARPLPRADDGVDARQRPPRRRVRRGRRRRRRGRESTGSSAPTAARGARPHRQRRDGGRRRVRDRDARRRRLRGRVALRLPDRATQGSLRVTSRVPRGDTPACPTPTPAPPPGAAAPRSSACALLLLACRQRLRRRADARAVRRRRRRAASALARRRPAAADQAVHALLGRRHRRQARRQDRGRRVVRQPRPSGPGGGAGAPRLAMADREAARERRPAPARGDDTAVKVCASFDLPIDNIPFTDRQILRIARGKTTEPVPAATVCYVWDAKLAAGTALDNAFTRRIRYIVLIGYDRLDAGSASGATSPPISCAFQGREPEHRAADRRHRHRRRFGQHQEPLGLLRQRHRPRA